MARNPIHPGEQLAEELSELEIPAAEFARRIGVPVSSVTEILNGEGRVTEDMAIRIAGWFGTTPEFWLNLQKLYESRLTCRAPSAGR